MDHLIKNRLAQMFLEWSGPDEETVRTYISRRQEFKNDEDSLNSFEDSFRAGSMRAEWFCIVTNFVNNRPYAALFGTFCVFVNISWSLLLALKKIF